MQTPFSNQVRVQQCLLLWQLGDASGEPGCSDLVLQLLCEVFHFWAGLELTEPAGTCPRDVKWCPDGRSGGVRLLTAIHLTVDGHIAMFRFGRFSRCKDFRQLSRNVSQRPRFVLGCIWACCPIARTLRNMVIHQYCTKNPIFYKINHFFSFPITHAFHMY